MSGRPSNGAVRFDLNEFVPPEQRPVDRALANYGAWARDKARQGHCASIEWRYAGDGYRELKGGAPVDTRMAVQVFEAVLGLPDRNRLAINLWYVNRADPKRIAQRVGVAVREVPLKIRESRLMVINRARRAGWVMGY